MSFVIAKIYRSQTSYLTVHQTLLIIIPTLSVNWGVRKMSQSIIGIAGNMISDAGETLYHLPISYTPQGYIEAVQKAGGIPLFLPIGPAEFAKTYIQQIDKLILAGGQDIYPKYYGQKVVDESRHLKSRDQFEVALIDEALRQGKPIFAVCRGMQLLNVYFGGSLYQDIEDLTPVNHMQNPIPREEPSHDLLMENSSFLYPIYGKKAKVNSFHHQAVKTVGQSLTVTAQCSDGIVEAIENKKQRILGVQWHPDFAYSQQEKEQAVFEYVVNQL